MNATRLAHTPISPRRRLVAILLALVCTLAGFAIGGTACASASQTPAVQAHLLWPRYDKADVERQLDKAREAGAGMVRVDLGWSSLEQDGKGRWSDWYLAKIDNLLTEAEARGIKVLFTVWETPCWASSAPEEVKQGCDGAWWDRDVQRYPPANPTDFGDALAFLVRRYGNRVAAWEIWNEPNHPDFFQASDKVGAYADLLKSAYPAAKETDPSATIIGGSLSDADFEFTEALFAQGVKGNFDAWSVHPYSEDRSPLHPGLAGWEKKSFSVGVPRVRDTMLQHGEDKPLWLTEFGWSTCTVRDDAAWRNCVDYDVQADYLQEAYEQMQAWSYVPVGVWFNLQNTSADLGDREANYGLLNYDGSEKPAFTAFKGSAAAMGSAPAAETPDPDTTAPDTSITSGPSGTVRSTTASFGLSSSESGSRFECRHDGGAWGECVSPKTYTGLSQGTHTFEVAATDAAGNRDATLATRTWKVDTVAPRVNGVRPSSGATGVFPTANVLATFSEAMRASRITRTTVKLVRRGTTTPVAVTVSYDPSRKRAKLDPRRALRRGAIYTATVTRGARDLAGNPLARTKKWSFTVRR